MSIDLDVFKSAMSHLAAGVTVITTRHRDTPIGITATSFTSLSLTPPLILTNLDKNLFTHQVMLESKFFAVNLLRAEQIEWGKRFAGLTEEADRFAGIETETAVTGAPILPHCLAWVDCRVWSSYDGGDHTIIVGEVVAVSERDNGGVPLLYYKRSWQQSIPMK